MDQDYKKIFENLPAAVAIHDEETGEIIGVNREALRIHESSDLEDLKKKSLFGDPPYSLNEVIEHVHQAARVGYHEFEWVSLTNQGEKYWYVRYQRVNLHGVNRIVMVSTDITDLKNAQKTIQLQAEELKSKSLELVREKDNALELSITDQLTGIVNRRRFDEVLANEWKRAARNGDFLALAMVDVDWFKKYNDRYGHQAGDECLRRVADLLKENVCRVGDVVARYGGEEFMIVLPNTDAEHARQLANVLCEAMQTARLPHSESPFGYVTFSIGIAAAIPERGCAAEELLKAADLALYRAKELGRKQVVVGFVPAAQAAPSA